MGKLRRKENAQDDCSIKDWHAKDATNFGLFWSILVRLILTIFSFLISNERKSCYFTKYVGNISFVKKYQVSSKSSLNQII